ncbi:squalene/phytoene synthase family protein [Sphingomonas abietis]|uniref:Squalene/phytoene synthase family protein n=1 Tax=Sphingomonas abietis TaxID=3012344 RepID=A0ABY7NI98_9SPHN|nr:squalene/phytoene synthase family protein [Sphingomonas abietis]WBO21250.1 squalene/phytoene synthase family protein [Sphingomonas abietis]
MTNVDREAPLPPEIEIALAYLPENKRRRVASLFELDAHLGSLVARAREPTIGLLRLTWWRDALAALDGGSVPPEPLLLALSQSGLPGAALADLTEGWEVLLDDPDLTDATIAWHAERRGAALFALAGGLLGSRDADAQRLAGAGAGWALTDLARHLSTRDRVVAVLSAARPPLDRAMATRWPNALRPLGMLAVLAREDARRGHEALRPPASRGRLLRLLAHRWTGR